jgi:hypothetical protein
MSSGMLHQYVNETLSTSSVGMSGQIPVGFAQKVNTKYEQSSLQSHLEFDNASLGKKVKRKPTQYISNLIYSSSKTKWIK